MNTYEMRRRVSAFLDAVNRAGVPVALQILCQALDRAALKAGDFRTVTQNMQPVKKLKEPEKCKPYYIQQQTGRKSRWKR